MDINLGKLSDTVVKTIENPKTSVLARVKWIFEKGELKWGTISQSKYEGKYWVQLPKFPFRIQGKTGWISPLIITDKEVEEELFNAALKIFTGSESFDENQKEVPEPDQEEEINLDEIPF